MLDKDYIIVFDIMYLLHLEGGVRKGRREEGKKERKKGRREGGKEGRGKEGKGEGAEGGRTMNNNFILSLIDFGSEDKKVSNKICGCTWK